MNNLLLKKNMVVATIAIIALGLAIAPTVFTNQAQAQANKGLTGLGKGTVICPPTQTVPPSNILAEISFDVKQAKGFTNGGWIISSPETGTYKDGQITGGTLNQKQFNLKGTEYFDGICGLPAPTTVTLKGTCGIGTTVEFIAANGEKGTFTANVACP